MNVHSRLSQVKNFDHHVFYATAKGTKMVNRLSKRSIEFILPGKIQVRFGPGNDALGDSLEGNDEAYLRWKTAACAWR